MASIIILSILTLILGLILGYAAIRFKVKGNPLVDQIDAILPQTQCGQCDFPGCRPYAEALAKGEAQINQCPPGGQEGVDAKNPLSWLTFNNATPSTAQLVVINGKNTPKD